VYGKIQDLYWLMRHMTPEEAARRAFADRAADIAHDVVMNRRPRGDDMLTDQAEAVRNWLGDYIQALKDAEARLQRKRS
jgi:hypothetical protein